MQKTLQYRHSQDVGLHISNAASEHHASRTSTEIYHEALHAMIQESIPMPQNKPAPEKALPEINMTTDDLYSSFLEDFTLPDPNVDFLEEPLDRPTVDSVKNETFFEDELSQVLSQTAPSPPAPPSQEILTKSSMAPKVNHIDATEELFMALTEMSPVDNNPQIERNNLSLSNVKQSPLSLPNLDDYTSNMPHDFMPEGLVAITKVHTPSITPEPRSQISSPLFSDTFENVSTLFHQIENTAPKPLSFLALPDGPVKSEFLHTVFPKTHSILPDHYANFEKLNLSFKNQASPYSLDNPPSTKTSNHIDTFEQLSVININVYIDETPQHTVHDSLVKIDQPASLEGISYNQLTFLPEYNFNDQTHTTHFKTSYLTAFHPLSNFTASQLSLLNSTPIFELVSQNQVQELSLAFQADYDDIDSSIGPVTVSKSPTQTSIMLDAPIPSVITANFAIDLMPEGQFTFIDSLFERPHMDEYLSIQYHPKNEEFFDSLPTSINTSQVEKNVLINKMIDAIGLELDISLPAKSLDPIEDKTHYFASDKITNALFYEIAFLIDKMPSHSCHELNISLNALYSLAFDENYMNTFEEMSFFNNIYDHHELYFFSEEMNAAETIIY